jgi:tripartite-type tricarboxylate transporter receptor subunit TctC
VAKSPEVSRKLEADGGFPVGSTPQQFSQVLAAEIGRYRKIVRDAGIKAEE